MGRRDPEVSLALVASFGQFAAAFVFRRVLFGVALHPVDFVFRQAGRLPIFGVSFSAAVHDRRRKRRVASCIRWRTHVAWGNLCEPVQRCVTTSTSPGKVQAAWNLPRPIKPPNSGSHGWEPGISRWTGTLGKSRR
jgi:hypothetical protein